MIITTNLINTICMIGIVSTKGPTSHNHMSIMHIMGIMIWHICGICLTLDIMQIMQIMPNMHMMPIMPNMAYYILHITPGNNA